MIFASRPRAPSRFRFKVPSALWFPLALLSVAGAARAEDCAAPAYAAGAARANAVSIWRAPVQVFGRPERGWAIYAPLMRAEVKTDCPADSAAFAAALGRWQSSRGLRGNGVVDGATLAAMKGAWQGRRPFVRISGPANCPAPPPAFALETAGAQEGLGGKSVQLRREALAAYRRMVQAARAEAPAIRRDRQALQIFSAYRSPDYDAARCARDGNCNGVVRASCSPHRTGLAMDLYVGQAPGFGPDSSVDANRYFQTRTPAYAWLVKNAHRFGFRPYAFEPWHWEWVGAPR